MSWRLDADLQEVLDNLNITSTTTPDNRLESMSRRRFYSNYTTQYLVEFWPARQPDYAGSSCTYEAASVFQVFYQDPTMYSTVSLSDYVFVGTYSCEDRTAFYPPLMTLCQRFGALDTLIGYAATGGLLHVVTKEGWRISGMSYASLHFILRVV